jgi:hypothetical protein
MNEQSSENVLDVPEGYEETPEALLALARTTIHRYNNVLAELVGTADLLLLSKHPRDPEYASVELILDRGKKLGALTGKLLRLLAPYDRSGDRR